MINTLVTGLCGVICAEYNSQNDVTFIYTGIIKHRSAGAGGGSGGWEEFKNATDQSLCT